jgi:hypothetical protein
MEEPKNELSPLFEPAAAPPPQRVAVTLDLDADVLEWLQEQPTDWQRELNNLARVFMETSMIRTAAFEEATGPEVEFRPQARTPPATPTGSTTSLSRLKKEAWRGAVFSVMRFRGWSGSQLVMTTTKLHEAAE